ncbi:MAG: hypothetical protein HGA78_06550 [Nitrospirales bacterium]|nr:hypothetical protein [Nitrospirales bacterium]
MEKFCSEEKLPCSFDKDRKYNVIDAPSWVVVGGGRFDWDEDQCYLRLYDISTAYGPFNAGGLAEKIRSVEGLETYRLLTG